MLVLIYNLNPIVVPLTVNSGSVLTSLPKIVRLPLVQYVWHFLGSHKQHLGISENNY